MRARASCAVWLLLGGCAAPAPSPSTETPSEEVGTEAAASEEILVLEVAPETAPCVGEMRGRCLQVREPGEERWRLFYDPIEGFEHQEGVRWVIEVARRAVPDPPADGSSWAWRLVRVMEREPGEGQVP